MKKLIALLGLVALSGGVFGACGSDDETTTPTKDKCGSETQACKDEDACVEKNCADEVSKTLSDCQTYLTCKNACDCGDNACILKCDSGACIPAAQAEANCAQSKCGSDVQACVASNMPGTAGTTSK